MPGIFGAIGYSQNQCEWLKHEFQGVWKNCESVLIGQGILGGHAFGINSAVYRALNGLKFAVDGEASLYRDAKLYSEQGSPMLFEKGSGEFKLTKICKGNIVVIDEETNTWYLATDWVGTFPLYYFYRNEKLSFSSCLRHLASFVGAHYDPYRVIEFLSKSYTSCGLTQYKDIYRLLPGQVLSYDQMTGQMGIGETSTMWVDSEDAVSGDDCLLAEAAWNTLRKAIRESVIQGTKNSLMMSAGWDSRLLLPSMLECLGTDSMVGYSHGDLGSLELQLAEKMCRSVEIECHLESLNESMYDLDFLQQGFERVGNIIFSHWHRAGIVLERKGVDCIFSGAYGEVLGGHYGLPMVLKGKKQILAAAAALTGRSPFLGEKNQNAVRVVYEFLRNQGVKKPWYLSECFWQSLPNINEILNDGVKTGLKRFRRRGVVSAEQMIEAFVSEHRGTQYINAQMLSCRSMVNVAIPYGDRDLLSLASRIPLTTKFHNSLNQLILQLYAPYLLTFPTAATLLPATTSIFLQELSRCCRKVLESYSWKFYNFTNGQVGPLRKSWVNYEFLRNGKALRCLLDDLQMEIWDKKALYHHLSAAEKFAKNSRMEFISDTFLKVYNTDLMLRKLKYMKNGHD